MGGVEGRAVWRERLRIIIFEAETPAGKAFDVALLWLIVLSVLAVLLESVRPVSEAYSDWFLLVEWVVTVVFALEYLTRLLCAGNAWSYARSFYGLVDLAAVLPSFLSLFLPGSRSLLVIRALRLIRIFRVLKLVPFLGEANVLGTALRASVPKVTVFLGIVLVVTLITGTLMYLIEGEENGFTSIPRSLYWAIVTMTTVGYGDIAPQTVAGQTLAAAVMILGYSIIAVPTGIVSAELVHSARTPATTRSCPACMTEGHEFTARYCKQCGEALPASP